jgi:dienelactone hydrolase
VRAFVVIAVVVGCSIGAVAEQATSVTHRVRRLRTTEEHAVIAGDQSTQSLAVFIVHPVGRGPFPLVVFNHGYGSVAEIYRPFLERLARQGYVVAGPNFSSSDVTTHPADITRVIDYLTGPNSLFRRGLVDARHIAVAGHSLGGADAYGVTYNTCCRDARITAALTFEAPLVDFPSGRYVWRGPSLLMVYGDADPLVAADTGKSILDQFNGGNAYLLTVKGGNHGGGLHAGEPGFVAVQRVVHEFLAANLKHDTRAAHALRSTTALGPTTLQRSNRSN